MKKRQPNVALIAEKMKRTSEYRERFCKEHSTEEVLGEFPSLRLPVFVSGLLCYVIIVLIKRKAWLLVCLCSV